jgi:hypothetical protein
VHLLHLDSDNRPRKPHAKGAKEIGGTGNKISCSDAFSSMGLILIEGRESTMSFNLDIWSKKKSVPF